MQRFPPPSAGRERRLLFLAGGPETRQQEQRTETQPEDLAAPEQREPITSEADIQRRETETLGNVRDKIQPQQESLNRNPFLRDPAARSTPAARDFQIIVEDITHGAGDNRQRASRETPGSSPAARSPAVPELSESDARTYMNYMQGKFTPPSGLPSASPEGRSSEAAADAPTPAPREGTPPRDTRGLDNVPVLETSPIAVPRKAKDAPAAPEISEDDKRFHGLSMTGQLEKNEMVERKFQEIDAKMRARESAGAAVKPEEAARGGAPAAAPLTPEEQRSIAQDSPPLLREAALSLMGKLPPETRGRLLQQQPLTADDLHNVRLIIDAATDVEFSLLEQLPLHPIPPDSRWVADTLSGMGVQSYRELSIVQKREFMKRMLDAQQSPPEQVSRIPAVPRKAPNAAPQAAEKLVERRTNNPDFSRKIDEKMKVMTDPHATLGEKFTAAWEALDLLVQMWEEYLSPPGSTASSPEGKDRREQEIWNERRNRLREEMKEKPYPQLRKEKEDGAAKKKDGEKQKLASLEETIRSEQAKRDGAGAKLRAAEAAFSALPPKQQQAPAARKNVNDAKAELQVAEETVRRLEAERAALQEQIHEPAEDARDAEELKKMKEGWDNLTSATHNTLTRIQEGIPADSALHPLVGGMKFVPDEKTLTPRIELSMEARQALFNAATAAGMDVSTLKISPEGKVKMEDMKEVLRKVREIQEHSKERSGKEQRTA